jgi:hypothetical protein
MHKGTKRLGNGSNTKIRIIQTLERSPQAGESKRKVTKVDLTMHKRTKRRGNGSNTKIRIIQTLESSPQAGESQRKVRKMTRN